MHLEELVTRRSLLQDGTQIHHAEAGSGRTLVFVHGGMGDWTSWAPQWQAFTPHFRCISYSRRYSWPNENRLVSREHSVVQEARDLAELLVLWDAAPAILVGTSYGAYTALRCALDVPAAVCALALTEPPVLPFADRTAGGRQARERFEQDVLTPAGQHFEAGRHDDAVRVLTAGINGDGPGEASTASGLQRRMRNAKAMQALAMSAEPYPALDDSALSALRIPTLLLRGARTGAVHRAVYEALSHTLTGPELDCIADAGHGVHRDNPAAFNARVLRFLAKV